MSGVRLGSVKQTLVLACVRSGDDDRPGRAGPSDVSLGRHARRRTLAQGPPSWSMSVSARLACSTWVWPTATCRSYCSTTAKRLTGGRTTRRHALCRSARPNQYPGGTRGRRRPGRVEGRTLLFGGSTPWRSGRTSTTSTSSVATRTQPPSRRCCAAADLGFGDYDHSREEDLPSTTLPPGPPAAGRVSELPGRTRSTTSSTTSWPRSVSGSRSRSGRGIGFG